MQCPTCKGTGKQLIQVHFHEKGTSTVRNMEIKCTTCEGTGVVSYQTIQALEKANKMWCRCGNPSGQSNFFDDGVDSKCSKHHWKCSDCGKILQVG